MTMELSGELVINKPLSTVRDTLTNPGKVAKCLPYLVSWEPRDKGFVATFRVDVGGIVEYLSRLTARASIEIREVDGNNIDYLFEGSIARARYSGVIHLNLEEEEPNKTRVRWRAEVELGRALQLLSRFINVDEFVNKIVAGVTESIISCVEENQAG